MNKIIAKVLFWIGVVWTIMAVLLASLRYFWVITGQVASFNISNLFFSFMAFLVLVSPGIILIFLGKRKGHSDAENL